MDLTQTEEQEPLGFTFLTKEHGKSETGSCPQAWGQTEQGSLSYLQSQVLTGPLRRCSLFNPAQPSPELVLLKDVPLPF